MKSNLHWICSLILLSGTYTGFCFYNPTVGRWLSRDPAEEGGGRNIYGFVLNDPLSQVDLFGQYNKPLTDDLQVYSEYKTKKIPCGNLELQVTFVDASWAETLESVNPNTFGLLLRSLQSPPSTWNLAKIKQPNYLGSGFILSFSKDKNCCCNQFEWVQMVKSPGKKRVVKDYDWKSSSGANFTAADYPGKLYYGFTKSDDLWSFDLTLYCIKDGIKARLYTVTWSSRVEVKPAPGSSAKVTLDIKDF